jgi:hypothetical protein
MPYEERPPDDYLSVELLSEKAHGYMRGIVPEWAELVTVGCDIGKHLLHWTAIAFTRDGSKMHIVDYGSTACPSREHGEQVGIKTGLDNMHELTVDIGWQQKTTGKSMPREIGCIDCNYNQEMIVSWCKEMAVAGLACASQIACTEAANFGQRFFKRFGLKREGAEAFVVDEGECAQLGMESVFTAGLAVVVRAEQFPSLLNRLARKGLAAHRPANEGRPVAGQIRGQVA